MLHKCANPSCSCLFRRLSLGKLFLLDRDSDNSADGRCGTMSTNRKGRSVRQIERYWLCDSCSALLTLTFERGRGMVTVPLPAGNTRQPALHLSCVQPTVKTYRAELKGAL
jgi:hypothetical protein